MSPISRRSRSPARSAISTGASPFPGARSIRGWRSGSLILRSPSRPLPRPERRRPDMKVDAPTSMARPSKPTLAIPPDARDAHVHVFGPRPRFPYEAGRATTPSDAPKETLFALHDFLGFERCVIVHTAAHGFDNGATADALAAKGGSYRGVALVPTTISDAELKWLDVAGFRGARFHYMRHLKQAASIDDVVAFGDRLAPLGWHLQIHMEAELIAELSPALHRAPVPVVIG